MLLLAAAPLHNMIRDSVACPYFYPTGPLDALLWRAPAHLPLGDACGGECRACDTPAMPSLEELTHWCNLGYARGQCPRFPAAPGTPDAARYVVTRDEDGVINIAFALECGHRPAGHGVLQYRDGAICGDCGENVRRQALFYARAYLRRKPLPVAVFAKEQWKESQ
jgi:hypothetical protein